MAIVFDATLGTVTNSGTLTTSAAAASASRVFLFVWWYDTVATCTGMSAGGGLTWAVDLQISFTGTDGGSHLGILSADAPSGLASSTALTPSFSTAVDFGPGMAAHSWTGVETGASGYVDATTTGTSDFAESWTTANLTTTLADTLLFGMSEGNAASQTHTEIANYTERHDWTAEGNNRIAVVSRVVAAAATYNPGGTWTQSVDFQINMGIAYKAAAGEEPPISDAPETLRVVRGPVRYR